MGLLHSLDMVQKPPKGADAIRWLGSMPHSTIIPVWQRKTISLPCNLSQKWLYVEGRDNQEDSTHGNIYALVVAPGTKSAPAGGVLRLQYTFEFSEPDTPSTGEETEIIYPSAPWIFTDSSSDLLSGKYLTFKWKEGGNMATWPGAEYGTVYKSAPGTKFYYIGSDSKSYLSQYFVVAKDVLGYDGQPVLCPCADKAHAEAYYKGSGDSTKLITYVAAGDWCTPATPGVMTESSSVQLIAPPGNTHGPFGRGLLSRDLVPPARTPGQTLGVLTDLFMDLSVGDRESALRSLESAGLLTELS